MEKIDRVINYFKDLKEEMMGAAQVPVNKVGDGGLTSRGKELAGYDPLMKFIRRKKVDYRKVPTNYKKWVKNLEK
jgi:hypothetical protein